MGKLLNLYNEIHNPELLAAYNARDVNYLRDCLGISASANITPDEIMKRVGIELKVVLPGTEENQISHEQESQSFDVKEFTQLWKSLDRR